MSGAIGRPATRKLFNELCLTRRSYQEYKQFKEELITHLPEGDGSPVKLHPGFLTMDKFLSPLGNLISDIGYDAKRWKGGIQLGPSDYAVTHNIARTMHVVETCDQKMTLIGHSYGGVICREIARAYPEHVKQVITMGSPHRAGVHEGATLLSSPFRLATSFNQKLGAVKENCWDNMPQHIDKIQKDWDHPAALFKYGKFQAMITAYNFFKTSEALKHEDFLKQTEQPIPVPCTHIYTRKDGIVNWKACISEEDEKTENIEVYTGHIGLPLDPLVWIIIADRLAQADEQWEKFNPKDWEHLSHIKPVKKNMAHMGYIQPPLTSEYTQNITLKDLALKYS